MSTSGEILKLEFDTPPCYRTIMSGPALYARSATWRFIVDSTRNKWTMSIFALGVLGLSMGAGSTAMKSTKDADLDEKLRKSSTLQSRMLAKAQKERLQVLFDEIKQGKGAARYQAALDGKSLGCHSNGTSIDAVAIKSDDRQ